MKKVLVVDDTKNIRMLLSTCLKAEGFDVYAADTGKEALELLERESFELIFLDIKMPEISGTEVLKKIRAANLDIPVVIMTAFATVKNAVNCTRLGAVAYLQKPFTTEKVRALLVELENTKNDVEYYINLSRELIDEGNVEGAFSMLKRALSINPSCSEVYRLIGKVYEIDGEIKEAEKFYRVAEQFENYPGNR